LGGTFARLASTSSGSAYVELQDNNGYAIIQPSAGTPGSGPQAGFALIYDASLFAFRPQPVGASGAEVLEVQVFS